MKADRAQWTTDMQIVTLDLDRFNSISIGARRYFILRREKNVLVAPSECPHRGGPLNLGKYSACRTRIVCPWHDTEYPVRAIARHALSAVVRGRQISILAEDGDVRVWKEILFLQ